MSRFREKIVSRELNARSYRDFAKNIALLGATSTKFAKSVGKKWVPTCDRDISNSAIYTTAIYRDSNFKDRDSNFLVMFFLEQSLKSY